MADSDHITQQLIAQTHVAFRYLVEIEKKRQGAFTECTLPTLEWELEEVKEGGLNTHVHQLPGRRKAARLTLKHGIARGELVDWYIQTLSEKFIPKEITVTLLDGASKPVASWTLHDAIPIKWVGPSLRSDANTIAIQTLEFAGGQVDFEVGA